MIFILFVLLAGSVFCEKPVPPGFHYIPTFDGNFHSMHESDIKHTERILSRYNPYQDVIFRLFTNKNGREPEIIEIDNAQALKKSSFDSSLETRFMVHGWGDNDVGGPVVTLVKDGYLDKANYNFFGVDWSKGSDTQNYAIARNRVNETGIIVGRFIEFLVREGGVNLDSIRIAGFSLGGHVVGNAGKYLKGQLPAVYSLDPAGPLFFENSNDRVTVQDAKYVEVIHTNGLKLGYDNPLGHIDYYPNNGRSQPGCGLDLNGACAHDRAVEFFAESMNSEKGFIGIPCKSRGDISRDGCTTGDGGQRLLGGDPEELPVVEKRLVLWLRTDKESPYALGSEGIE